MSLHWLGVNQFHCIHHTHPHGALIITGTQADCTGSSTKVARSSEKCKVRCEEHPALEQEREQDPCCGRPCQWHWTPMWRMDNGLARLRGKYYKRCLKLPPPYSIFLDLFFVKSVYLSLWSYFCKHWALWEKMTYRDHPNAWKSFLHFLMIWTLKWCNQHVYRRFIAGSTHVSRIIN